MKPNIGIALISSLALDPLQVVSNLSICSHVWCLVLIQTDINLMMMRTLSQARYLVLLQTDLS